MIAGERYARYVYGRLVINSVVAISVMMEILPCG